MLKARPASRGNQPLRVLVAGTGEAIGAISAALADEAEVIPAQSVLEALQRMEERIDIVVCNVRFDESRMFDFLLALNQRPKKIPVVCVRLFDGLSPGVRKALTEALAVLGVATFLDVHEVAERDGEEVAAEALRQLLLGVNRPG